MRLNAREEPGLVTQRRVKPPTAFGLFIRKHQGKIRSACISPGERFIIG